MVSSCKQTFSYVEVNSVLITLHFRIIAYDEKLSVMLSEVPWMKFRVIAEPDFSVFTRHPVMQSTLTQIATTTVEHVTAKFEALMALALAETIQVVTQSAMEHVEQSLIVLTQNLSAAAGGYAHLHETYTASGNLQSQFQVCSCKPFQCSCPPFSADMLANGHTFQSTIGGHGHLHGTLVGNGQTLQSSITGNGQTLKSAILENTKTLQSAILNDANTLQSATLGHGQILQSV